MLKFTTIETHNIKGDNDMEVQIKDNLAAEATRTVGDDIVIQEAVENSIAEVNSGALPIKENSQNIYSGDQQSAETMDTVNPEILDQANFGEVVEITSKQQKQIAISTQIQDTSTEKNIVVESNTSVNAALATVNSNVTNSPTKENCQFLMNSENQQFDRAIKTVTSDIIVTDQANFEEKFSFTPRQEKQITIATHSQDTSAEKVVIESNTSVNAALAPVNSNVTISPMKASSTGFALLSQYDSEIESDTNSAEKDEVANISDTESLVEVKPNVNDYRNQVVEIDSESSSDSSSSDYDKNIAKLRKKITKCIEVENDEDEDDDDSICGKASKRQPLVKGELTLDDLPPIQDLQISVPEEECIEFGRVHSIVDQLLLVSALPNSILLDLDTVLFLEKGKRVLGEVFDVLGQVADPLYCIRFNNNNHIHKKGINVGDVVYVAPKTEYTQYIILSSLMKNRGSDASWENDIEPPPRYLDYSDDEQEREARQQLRNKNRKVTENESTNKRINTHTTSDNSEVEFVSQTDATQHRFGTNRRRRGGSYSHHYGYPQSSQSQNVAGSWHSHYNHPNRNSAGYNYRGYNAGMQRMPRPMYGGPPGLYHPYSEPPMHFMPQQRPTYVMNPFAFRPPALPPQEIGNAGFQIATNQVLAAPPPPPPPKVEPEPPAPGSTD